MIEEMKKLSVIEGLNSVILNFDSGKSFTFFRNEHGIFTVAERKVPKSIGI